MNEQQMQEMPQRAEADRYRHWRWIMAKDIYCALVASSTTLSRETLAAVAVSRAEELLDALRGE